MSPADAPPLPSVARQAAGLVRAAVQAVSSGGEWASPGLVAARLAACHEGAGLPPDAVAGGHCDHLRDDGRCGGADGCGCYVDVKAQLAAWDCPLGRWPSALPDARHSSGSHGQVKD